MACMPCIRTPDHSAKFMENFWQTCSAKLEQELTPQQFSAWIKPLAPLDYEDGRLRIADSGTRAITALDLATKAKTVLVDRYRGKPKWTRAGATQ